MQPSIKTVQNLQDWFTRADKPTWILYQGSRITQVSQPVAVNYTIDNTLGAWTFLQQTLQQFGNIGTFCLLVKKSKQDSKSQQTVIIELNPSYQQPQPQQINGIGNPYMRMPYPMGQTYNEFSPEVKAHIEKQVSEKLALERRLMQSEFDLKQMKLEIVQKATPTDKLLGSFAENPDKFIAGLSMIFSSKKTPQTAQLGVLTDNSKVPPVQDETQEVTSDKKEQPTAQEAITKTLDFNKVNQSAIVLYNNGIKDIDDIMLQMAMAIQNDKKAFLAKIEMLKNLV